MRSTRRRPAAPLLSRSDGIALAMQLLEALEMASSPGNCHGDSSPYSLNPEEAITLQLP